MYKIIISSNISPADNMMVDNYLAFHKQDKYIRVYSWQKPCISLGLSNTIDKLNLCYIKKHHIALVRRQTGGGYVNHGNDICFSVMENAERKPREQFYFVRHNIQRTLEIMGFPRTDNLEKKVIPENLSNDLCFNQLNRHELSINSKKIAGIAQRLRKDRYLTQGSVSVSKPPVDFNIFYTGLQVNNEKTGYLSDFNLNLSDFFEKFCEIFSRQFAPICQMNISTILEETEYKFFKSNSSTMVNIENN